MILRSATASLSTSDKQFPEKTNKATKRPTEELERDSSKASLTLAQKVKQLIQAVMDPKTRTEQLLHLLSPYSAEDMPLPEATGLSEKTWLRAYWEKKIIESGYVFSREERFINMPKHISLALRVDALFSLQLEKKETLSRLQNLLSTYKAKDLPSPLTCNLSQETWLHIYWEKLGEERGHPLSKEETPYNIPTDSALCLVNDPLSEYIKSSAKNPI